MGDERKKMLRSPLASAICGTPGKGLLDGSDYRSWDTITPLSMDVEWDPYVRRKHGLQPVMGVMRNDRTPLNTPYTPQLMKLHLKRHEAYDEREKYAERPGKQLVTMVKSNLELMVQPVYKIRAAVYRLVTIIVPSFVQETTFFAMVHPWAVWYLTVIVCVPFIMLLSPMLIALSICTSPIWISGIVVLFVRLLVRCRLPVEDDFSSDTEEEEETSPHHPNSVYRRAHLMNSYNQRKYC